MIGCVSIVLINLCLIYLSFCIEYLYLEKKADKRFETKYESWKHERTINLPKCADLYLLLISKNSYYNDKKTKRSENETDN